MSDGGYHNQDRSIALKGRLLRERRLLPSVVAGGNDIYSSAEKGNRYFKTCYAAAGKHFSCAKAHIYTSLGYGFETSGSDQLTGFFGGISLSPGFTPSLECMAEYDSKAFNTGVSLTFFNHLRIVGFAYNLRHFTGCLMYKICL
ncbi:MAG: YjbH domain-containing protein [Mangrovibacterium sp.]